MAFLNAMGSVSRRGRWRVRRELRAAAPDGRLDLSDAGLIDLSSASEIRLTVTPRSPLGLYRYGAACLDGAPFDPPPVLVASTADGSLLVANPGFVEAVFPDGWGRCISPGLYDVRITVTIGAETADVFDQPVEIR